MAHIDCLFLLHFTALQTLAQNSSDVAYFSGHMDDRESSNQLMTAWLADVQIGMERRQAQDYSTSPFVVQPAPLH
jgi:hypothetical protein